ncbi:MAG: phage tail sheath family protein [Microcoleus sp. SU_5_6]|nr:phage tail sheath family protein [Microcoleus sp. SU_5_6]
MPVNLSYPGIYIEELPSNARTITAAPTSITVFVGYTHPFKTKPTNFKKAVQIFNFTDYENEFGGLYRSGLVRADVADAVNQFFLNGGSVAYVVGLPLAITPPTQNIGGINFTPRELTDTILMKVSISNVKSAGNTADIVITYGSRSETYRGVSINANSENYVEKRIGTVDKPISSLVTVSAPPGGYTVVTKSDVTLSPPSGSTTFNSSDFLDVFDADSDLDKVPIFNLLVIPGVADNGIWSAALAFCERKQAFVILDSPAQAIATPDNITPPESSRWIGSVMDTKVPKSQNGAIYFPYLKSNDPLTGNPMELPPSGFVAGIYARTDLNRGVWKAPAGLETTILNATGVVESGRMTDARQGTLNLKGINCLRSFPGIGTVVYGARTLIAGNTALAQWKYVPVRRITLFIEQTLYRNLGWVVFEPNDEPLWAAIRLSIEGFMLSLFSQGAFQGSTPSQAFQVKCDKSTTTQTDIDNGIVNIIVAFAPLKPAEFVIIKIAQLAGQVQS